MDDPAEARRMVSLRWIALSVSAAVSLGLFLFGTLLIWQWWTSDRHRNQIAISTEINPTKCPDPKRPVHVSIRNNSSKIIDRLSLGLEARRPGRSADVTTGYFSMDSDYHVPPGKGLSACANKKLADDARDEDPTKLIWTAVLLSVHFSD
jgi:hypothetical protein